MEGLSISINYSVQVFCSFQVSHNGFPPCNLGKNPLTMVFVPPVELWSSAFLVLVRFHKGNWWVMSGGITVVLSRRRTCSVAACLMTLPSLWFGLKWFETSPRIPRQKRSCDTTHAGFTSSSRRYATRTILISNFFTMLLHSTMGRYSGLI